VSLLVRGCRVVSPGKDLAGASIEIEGGRIRRILPRGAALPEAGTVLDADGLTAVPGFVDIHFHGAAGHDVTEATVDAVAAIAKAKLDEGVTTICPTTLTLPEERLRATMEAVAAYRRDERYARVAGVHLEGPFIHPDCVGAQNPDHVRRPDADEVMRLHAITPVAIVTLAPEVEGGLETVRRLAEAGIVASCGHSSARHAEYREARRAGLRHLTHFCNQMTGLHHREIGLVGAGLLDEDVLIEMICDRIHLCAEMIELLFKLKPVERIALVTDSISATGLGDGDYDLGGLAVRVRGSEARLASSGALAGSVLRYNEGLRHVHEITGRPLAEIVRTTSLNQAESLGLEKLGRIEEGWRADLALLDDRFDVEAVFVEGERRR
jgi:N-acetylglucosamine-6-phosphate deacetylase